MTQRKYNNTGQKDPTPTERKETLGARLAIQLAKSAKSKLGTNLTQKGKRQFFKYNFSFLNFIGCESTRKITQAVSTPTLLPKRGEAKNCCVEEREGTIGIVGDKTTKIMAAKSSGLLSGFMYHIRQLFGM